MSDRVFGGLCLALAAAYLYSATGIQLPFLTDPIGPRTFPYIIGGVLALAALYPILRPDEEPDWPHFSGLREIALAVVIMVGYALVLRDAGFVASTAVAAALLSWRLGSRPHWAALAGILISVILYTLFHLVLGLSLARGPWGF